MKKGLQRLLSCFLVASILACGFPVSASPKAPARKIETIVAQMGQVTMHFIGLRLGGDSYDVAIDLNGYMPQTISDVITGNFTKADLERSYENYAAFASPTTKKYSRVSQLVECPRLNDNPYAKAREWTHDYASNIYRSKRTFTEVVYSIIPPADLPVESITFAGPVGNAALYSDHVGSHDFVQTTHHLYMDGQLIFEYSLGTNKGDAWYKVHQADFQTTEPKKTETARPTASNIFIDGKKVSLGAYLINGNNYVKLRDMAYLLNGTTKQFNVIWHSKSKTIEIQKKLPYDVVGGEMRPLATGPVSASLSSAVLTHKGENPNIDPYNDYYLPKAYNIGGNNYYKLRDLAQIAGFTVDWDAATNNVIITTT